MPIVKEYAVPGVLEAAFAGSQGVAGEEQRFRQAQMDQRDRLAAQENEMRLALAGLQARLERQRMGQQAYQYDAGLGLEYDQLAAHQQSQQQELEARNAASEAMVQRAAMSQMGQTARAAEDRKFEMFVADRDFALKNWRRMTPLQRQQVQEQISEHYGYPWDLPEQIMAQQEMDGVEAERQRWSAMLTAPDGSGEMIADEATIDILMQMEPKEALAAALKEKSEWRQRKALEQKAQLESTKVEEATANIERDDVRAEQEIEIKQRQFEQELEQMKRKHELELKLEQEKMRLKAQEAFRKDHKTWEESPDVDAEGKPVVSKPAGRGPEPKMEDYLPKLDSESQSTGGVKTISSKAEYDALPSGAEYINAKTGRRARKP